MRSPISRSAIATLISDSGKQVTFERDALLRIVSVLDPMGNKISYGYDALSNLVKVTDQEQRETKFVYDGQKAHYLKEIIDPLGRTGAKTEYDENGRLKQVINGAGVPINIEYNPSESIQIVKDAYNNPTVYKYDERGNVLQVTNALGHSTFMQYDENNNLTQVKDPNNLITKYQYDNFGNLISRTEPYCGCPGVVPGTTYYTYNNYGQPTSIVLPTGASLHMQYDRFGNMLSMKDGKGSVIQSFTYSPKGLVLTETDTTGTTTYQYDAVGNVIKTIDADGGATTMEYFADGKLKKMIEDNGTPLNLSDDEISTFTYDKLGREKRADYGNGIWVEYGYGVESDWSTLTAPTIGTIERKFTTDGKLKGWVTPDGGTPTFFYDQVGRLWRETDAQGNVTTEYGYDAAGRLTSVKDVRTGATTLKRYDAGNRPIEEIDPLGGYTKYVYHPQNGKMVSMERGQYVINAQGVIVRDAAGNPVVDTTVLKQTWSYEYNGLQTTVTDPLERKTTAVQDDYLLPTETIFQQRNGRDYRTSTKYLYNNNLQEAKDYPTEIVDIGGNDRDFTYDSDGRLWKATDLDNNTTTYTYGDNGLEQITGPTGETLKYRYEDALDNLTRVIYGNNTVKQMSYRPTDNRLGTTTLPSGETITYDYDAAGRIKSETTKSASGTITNTVSYTYDANSNVKTVTDNTGTTTYHYDPNTGANSGIDYPNGSSIAYTYDLLGRVKTIAEKASATATAYVTTYDYDAFGNLKSVLDPAGNTTTMKYDVGNRLKERLLPNGVKSVYEYDDLDRVKSIVHTNASGTVLASVTYERKGIGEPTKITREDGSFVALEYDAALRVKKESYYNAAGVLQDETSYTYDAAGKRLVQSTTRNNITSDRSYNYTAGYQLDAIAEPGETENYDYDANGRLTYIVRDGKTLDLEHDGSDRLTVVENETTGSTIQYTYDGQGRRVAATEGTAQRRFLVAPAMGSGLESTDLIADGNGNLISNYVYAGGTSPFMRLDASGNPIYYLTDAMGTVIGLANQQGQSAGKFLYDAFGNILTQVGSDNSGAAGGDFRFQGQWLEQSTGIYHFRARDYDPKTGTFISRDPVDIIEAEPESFNPYQFVYNNPYVYSDPSGEITISELNVSQVLRDTLRDIQSQTLRRGVRGALDRAQGVATDVFSSVIRALAPSFDTKIDSYGTLFGPPLGGNAFEIIVQNFLCKVVGGAYGSILNNIWLEAGVDPSGNPRDNGYGCGSVDFDYSPSRNRGSYSRSSLYNHPDFIIKRNPPFDTDRMPPAYLIGDFKRSVTEATRSANPRQWDAIMNYARSVVNGGHQYIPVALYVTLRGEQRQGQVERRKAQALRQFVILQIVSLFDF